MRSLDYVRSVRNAAIVALAFVALPASGAAAQQRVPWLVVESHGEVTQQTADGVLPIASGATLAEGVPVKTGADGTLVLAHGNDRLSVSANSAFAVPVGVDPAGPSILQTLGTLLFKVEHTPGRRFEVDTPYLAAVVKGTVFTVSVNGSAHMVHVAEGAVEVTASASHDAVLVRPGQTATLSSPNAAPSVIDGRSPAGTPGSKSEREHAPRDDKRSEATQALPSAAPEAPDERGALRLTQTLGDQRLDVSALTNGLIKPAKELQPVASTPLSVEPVVAVPGAPSMAAPSVNPKAPSVDMPSPGAVVAPVADVPSPVSAPVANAPTPTVASEGPRNRILAPITAALPGPNSPAFTRRKP